MGKTEPGFMLQSFESLIFLTTGGPVQCYVDNRSRSTERGIADSNGVAFLAKAKPKK